MSTERNHLVRSTARYLGSMSGYPMFTRPNKGSTTVWPVIKSFFGASESIMEEIKRYHRSTPSLVPLLERLMKYETPIVKKSEDPLLWQAYDMTCAQFTPPRPFRVVRLQDIDFSSLTQDTNPGYPYYQQGFRSRSECWDLALRDAEKIWARISSGEPVTFPPYMLFGKGDVCPRAEPKTRLIFGESSKTMLVRACFAIPIRQFQMRESPAAYRYTPYGAGYSKLASDVSKFLSVNSRSDINGAAFDFKGYDFYASAWEKRATDAHWKRQFDWSTFSDGTPNPDPIGTQRVFDRLTRYDIDTRVLAPNGDLFQLGPNGDRSGNIKFQLDQNFRTYWKIQYIILKLGYELKFLSVLGDDATAIWRGGPIDFGVANYHLREATGAILNSDKCARISTIFDVQILGRKLKFCAHTRDTADIVLALLYPAHTDRDDLDVAMRTVALYYESVGNHTLVAILKKVWYAIDRELRELLESCGSKLPWPAKWRKHFSSLGFSSPPPISLPSDERVFHMYYNYSAFGKFKHEMPVNATFYRPDYGDVT